MGFLVVLEAVRGLWVVLGEMCCVGGGNDVGFMA